MSIRFKYYFGEIWDIYIYAFTWDGYYYGRNEIRRSKIKLVIELWC